MELTRVNSSSFFRTSVLQALSTYVVALVVDVSSSLHSHAFILMVVLLPSWARRTLFQGLVENSNTVSFRGTYTSCTISIAGGSKSIVILGISLRFLNLGLWGIVLFRRISKDLLVVKPR